MRRAYRTEIRIIGCNTTKLVLELTERETILLERIAAESVRKSNQSPYGCMPIIEINRYPETNEE